MAEITAKDVQRLRQSAGVGMMDAKKALTEADGDLDKALELLRERGLAKMAKRADREAVEGTIGSYLHEQDGRTKSAVIVHLASETDFVAKSDEFKDVARGIAMHIAWHKPLYINREKAKELGIADDDWVWVTSHNGRIKVQAKQMDGVNKDTVWTWNAIGKRAGAWNLDPGASEATRGFLLNYLISELLPADGDSYRYSNSDPLTGQAAWFDLRVRVERAAEQEQGEMEPRFEPTKRPPNLPPAPTILRYGEAFRQDRAKTREPAG